MAIGVQTNVSSLIAQRQLSHTNRALSDNIAKLSSGFRINSAADDAAGLAISETLKSDISSLNQASRNANDAISVVQTAESALGEMTNIVGRMRELAVQANSEAISSDQRALVQVEFDELIEALNETSERARFNENQLLDGTADLTFQTGLNATDTINIVIGDAFDAEGLGLNNGTNNLDLTDLATIATSIEAIEDAIKDISEGRAVLGAIQNRLDSTLSNLATTVENLEAANSRIRDLDIAAEMADLTKNQILIQAGTSMTAQANSIPQAALALLS